MRKFYTSLLASCLVILLHGSLSSQTKPDVPWSFGGHVGLNYNMSGVGYGIWTPSNDIRQYGQFIPYVRNEASGMGLYGGLNAQYMPLSWLGIQGRLSYDNRSFTAHDDQTFSDGNGGHWDDQFDFHLSLLNLELLAKFYLTNRFHLTAGGGLGYKLNSTYDALPQGGAKFEGLKIPGSSLAGSFIAGMGYEIPLSDATAKQQVTLTPFVELSYMVGLREVDFAIQSGFADALSVVTLRAGAALAFGNVAAEAENSVRGAFFRVTPPEDGVYARRTVEEFIPIRPFVFFDPNNTSIPSRYSNISASDTAAFNRRTRTEFDAKDLSNVEGRTYRQGEVYYNLANIIGSRMNERPGTTITLIGSDPKEKNGLELAETVKKYMVETWGISPDRITTKGQENPPIPSGSARTPEADKPLAEIENRRVEFVASDPYLVKRAQYKADVEPREENQAYVELMTDEKIESWQAIVSGFGKSRTFGPFTSNDAYLDAQDLFPKDQNFGNFKIEVIAKTTDGRTLSDAVDFSMFRNDKSLLAQRYSLVFEFNDSDPEGRANDFLNDVTPRVETGQRVYISGFTDNIGNDDVNMKLSKQRAAQVMQLLKARLQQAGIKAIIRGNGYGENSTYAPFPNTIPEGRMYNRTVIVDIVR